MASGLGARRKIVEVPAQTRIAIWENLAYLKSHPYSVAGHHNLAVLYLHANRKAPELLEAAFKHLKIALKYDPGHVATLIDMGVALLRTGQASRAESYARLALEQDACSAMAYNTLASAQAAQQKTGKAMKSVGMALYYAPESAAIRRNYASLLRASGQTHKAIEHYMAIVRLAPNDVNNYVHLCSALVSEGRRADAMKYAKIVNDLTGKRIRRAGS